ncbi:hypothetical protein LZ30DRAFT_379690 [Colletotrichum cereale]|nr:hypothetical protein LZ30DRAFT_379690 [Colletotrichum cereale]
MRERRLFRGESILDLHLSLYRVVSQHKRVGSFLSVDVGRKRTAIIHLWKGGDDQSYIQCARVVNRNCRTWSDGAARGNEPERHIGKWATIPQTGGWAQSGLMVIEYHLKMGRGEKHQTWPTTHGERRPAKITAAVAGLGLPANTQQPHGDSRERWGKRESERECEKEEKGGLDKGALRPLAVWAQRNRRRTQGRGQTCCCCCIAKPKRAALATIRITGGGANP